jgi:hypothetical protein
MSWVKRRPLPLALCLVTTLTITSCFERRPFYQRPDARGGYYVPTNPEPRPVPARGSVPARPAESPVAAESATPAVDSEFVTVASRPLALLPVRAGGDSYGAVQRSLNQNRLPPADVVRVAELVNHFAYHYAGPTGDKPVALDPEVWPCPWNLKHYLLRVGVQARSADPARKERQATPVAKEAAIQVEFNPRFVDSYRLIGYERGSRSRAETEPKGDDLVVGQSFTALYELVPPGQGPKLKYQPADARSSPFTDNAEWLTVRLRYKDPTGAATNVVEAPADYSQETAKVKMPSRDFQLAAAVAAFGLELSASPHKGDLAAEQVERLADGVLKRVDAFSTADEPRRRAEAEFLQLVKKAAALKKSETQTAKND